jgi:hypothetical protein
MANGKCTMFLIDHVSLGYAAALVSEKADITNRGIDFVIRPATGEGFLNEVMAQISRAVDFPDGNWISSLVLCLTGWPNLALGCADHARRGGFTY